MIQEPVVIMDFVGNIANGATELSSTHPTPIDGNVLIYGIVTSNNDVTVYIDMGIDDQSGLPAVYDYSRSFPVLAGTAEERNYPLAGKFARMRVENLSGFIAAVKIHFKMRSHA